MARVNERSHSLLATRTFIRRWNEPFLVLLPSCRAPPQFSVWPELISCPAEGWLVGV